MGRGGHASTATADLVRKGLVYEALAAGANDPVIKNLLRTLDLMIRHRIAPWPKRSPLGRECSNRRGSSSPASS
jgi:hypothetical protein